MSAISQGFANDFHEWYSQNLKLWANHLNSNHKSWFKISHIFISYMLYDALKHMYIDENTSELPILTLSTKTAYNCDVKWMWGACITTSTLHWKQKNVILITLSSLVATYVLMTTHVATSDDKVVEWTILCFQCSDYSQNNSRDAVPSQSWYWSIEAWTKGLKFCSPHSEMHNHSSSNFYPRTDVWINIDEQPKPHQN